MTPCRIHIVDAFAKLVEGTATKCKLDVSDELSEQLSHTACSLICPWLGLLKGSSSSEMTLQLFADFPDLLLGNELLGHLLQLDEHDQQL